MLIALIVAFVLWTLMFSPWTAPYIPFWQAMTVSALILTALSLYFGGNPFKSQMAPSPLGEKPIRCDMRSVLINIALGVGIAVALWGVFWVGDKLSQLMFPSFARTQVNTIYGMKDGFNGLVISLLLLFVIGPAEEIFWRAFIQRQLALRWGKLGVALGIALYALAHLFSFNFMLIMAALVCGIVWGVLYYLFPHRLPALILSHALWDAAVFIWFPI